MVVSLFLTSNIPDLEKPDGKAQVFEFDFTKDSLADIADFIWDNV